MSNNIEGKVIVITGASSGLGEATSRLLCAQGVGRGGHWQDDSEGLGHGRIQHCPQRSAFRRVRSQAQGQPTESRLSDGIHNMDIKRSGSQPSSKGPADWFTGTVRIDPLFQANAPAHAAGASVTFEPGARTA
jgi:hypothetical protein